MEIGSEISQDSSETNLAGHSRAGQHGPVSPLGFQLPALGLDHFQHLALHVCTTLQHVCTTPAQGSLTQQCLSLLHPLYALPSCQRTHCARQTNEDHSKCRGILKYSTQSHQNTAVCPDGPTLLHYGLLQGCHALCFRLVCQKAGTVPVIYSTFSQMALTCLYKLWQMSI